MYLILITLLTFNSAILDIDFGIEKDGRNWLVVNDGVMGGLSLGRAGLDENSLLFVGEISFDNNGGFASVRSNRMRLDLKDAEFIELRYRLTGLNFALRFEEYSRFWQPYYSYPLEVTNGEWVTMKIPVNELRETRLSNYTGKLFDKEKSRPFFRLGLMSNDKKEERFELELDYIKIY